MRDRENEEYVQIKKKDLEKLQERSNWLTCLEHAGVDNWMGIDFACDLRNEMEKEKELQKTAEYILSTFVQKDCDENREKQIEPFSQRLL